MIPEKKKIYFIAICGTAMASLASMLKKQGHYIYGSDENIYPPMSTFLAEQGIDILPGFDPTHLNPAPDLVVIGNAMSRGNPEVEYVLEHKIPYQSLPVVLKEFFIQGKTSLVVTGTHGKTTTTSLLSWLLEKNGADPSFLIGGIPENFKHGSKVGKGNIFVVEGDEYDTAFFDKGPKFLHYLPDVVILNNIEFDHADIYASLDEIKLSFRRLINLIPRNGLLIANGDDPNVCALLDFAFCPVLTFGTNPGVNFVINNVKTTQTSTRFDIIRENQYWGEFKIPLFGLHNVRNATAVLIAAKWLGYSKDQIQAAFSEFLGIKRRLQLRADIHDILIFDDFAHHPTAIKETIDGLSARFPDRRLFAVYEPRTSTAKRNIFFEDYLNAFNHAAFALFGPIHRPDKVKADTLLSLDELCNALTQRSKVARHFENVAQIVQFLKENLIKNDVVLIMSNGSFDNIHEKLITSLR
jgi:UDP-N-acetylmuramate: L-alanyl-gamma-D-glutamyl-meso-diaminopimelate ligase